MDIRNAYNQLTDNENLFEKSYDQFLFDEKRRHYTRARWHRFVFKLNKTRIIFWLNLLTTVCTVLVFSQHMIQLSCLFNNSPTPEEEKQQQCEPLNTMYFSLLFLAGTILSLIFSTVCDLTPLNYSLIPNVCSLMMNSVLFLMSLSCVSVKLFFAANNGSSNDSRWNGWVRSVAAVELVAFMGCATYGQSVLCGIKSSYDMFRMIRYHERQVAMMRAMNATRLANEEEEEEEEERRRVNDDGDHRDGTEL